MGTIAQQFATAFRDFATDGVASSGPHEVIKEEVRAIGPLIEAALGAVSLGSVDVIKATRANLNADLAHPADAVALVYGDATDTNNDLYIKVGASGTGSWTLTTILHDVIGSVVAAEVVAQVDPKVAAAQLAETNAETAETNAEAAETGALAAKAAIEANYPLDVNGRVSLLEAAVSYGAIAATLALHNQQEIVLLKRRLAEVERGGIAAWALAARVRNSGWELEIDVAEAYAGGTFDKTKLRLISYDWGFNADCQPCVRPRAIEITRAMRKPGVTTPFEDTSAGITTWRLSLSEQMFAKAKANTGGQTVNSGIDPVLYLAEGWYADGGVSAPDQDGLRVQNNSTEAYPLVAVRNFTPPFRLLGATGKFEVSGNSVHATEGRVYAAARCDIVGQTSGVTRTQIVKQMIESDFYPKRTNAVPVFQANINMTAFTQNESVTERWRLYPWIGDTPTDSNTGNFEAGDFATHTHWVNHAGTFPKVFAVVDPVAGNDTTGAASTVSEAAAAATPFATDKAAWYRAWQMNQSSHGRNNQSGIEICFSNTTHTLTLLPTVFSSGSLATFDAAEVPKGGTWAVMRPVTGATNCRLARNPSTGVNGTAVPRRTVLRGFNGLDLVGTTSGTPTFINGNEPNNGSYGHEIWIDNSPFIDSTGLTSTVIGLYQCGKIWMTNCNQPAVGNNAYGFGNVRHNYMLVRDTDLPGPTYPGAVGSGFAFGGCAFGQIQMRLERPAANTNMLPLDNIVIVGFSMQHTNNGNAGFRGGDQMETTRCGMLNVLIESWNNSQPALFISGDGSNIRIRNFFADYLTVVGNRLNSGYEDTFVMTDDGDPDQQLKKLFVFRRTIFYEVNTKHDLFSTVNALKRHAWNHAHRVGWKYVRIMCSDSAGGTAPGNGSWSGEAWPSTMAYVGPDARAQFVDYKANHKAPASVTGTGGGNYMPAAGSVFLGIIPSNDEACPIDLRGNARNGAVGALERVA